jgi:hypothetical protein
MPENAVTKVVPREVAHSRLRASAFAECRAGNCRYSEVEGLLPEYGTRGWQHKARVFAAVLGVRLHDADWLQERLRGGGFRISDQVFRK